jgi:hypothetical protein
MNREMLAAHATALESIAAAMAALAASIRSVAGEEPKGARSSDVTPQRCNGMEPHQCALSNDDAVVSMASFASPRAWKCRGCGFVDAGTTVTLSN